MSSFISDREKEEESLDKVAKPSNDTQSEKTENRITENEEKEENKNPWLAVNEMLCNNRCFICTQGFPRGKKKKVFMVSQILQSFSDIYSTKSVVGDISDGNNTDPTFSSTVAEESAKFDDIISSSASLIDSPEKGSNDSLQGHEGRNIETDDENERLKEWSIDRTTGDPRLILFINFKDQCPHVWACWKSFYSMAGTPEREQQLIELLAEADVQVWMSGLACCRSDMCSAIYRAITSDNSKNELIASILASKEKYTHKNTFCPPGCDCDSPWQFMNL